LTSADGPTDGTNVGTGVGAALGISVGVTVVGTSERALIGLPLTANDCTDGVAVGETAGDAVASRSKMTERRLARSVAVSGAVRPMRALRRGESVGSGTHRPRAAAHAGIAL
jgi:hypothetical protein